MPWRKGAGVEIADHCSWTKGKIRIRRSTHLCLICLVGIVLNLHLLLLLILKLILETSLSLGHIKWCLKAAREICECSKMLSEVLCTNRSYLGEGIEPLSCAPNVELLVEHRLLLRHTWRPSVLILNYGEFNFLIFTITILNLRSFYFKCKLLSF